MHIKDHMILQSSDMRQHDCPATLAIYTPKESLPNSNVRMALIIPGEKPHNHLSWLPGAKITPQQRKAVADALDAAGNPTIAASQLTNGENTLSWSTECSYTLFQLKLL